MNLPPWNDHPAAPAMGSFVCLLEDIPEEGGKEFFFGTGDKPFRMFVLRFEGGILAYVNACTHFIGTPLNPQNVGNFLDPKDPSLIVCGVHRSRFLVTTGACVSGDCEGIGLQKVPVQLQGAEIIIG